MKYLATPVHAHLLGIGGIGVSAVARLLLARGHRVSGSDVRESAITRGLAAEGARVHIGHRPSNLEGADLVMHSTAIPESNPELIAARESGLPVVHRSVLLGELMEGRRSLGVTGTNGKGTVSAMIAWLLDAAGVAPSFAIGGMVENFGTNARETFSRTLVCELDESDGSFVNTRPDVLVLANLEADHLNYYKDLDGLLSRFAAYLSETHRTGSLVANGDDVNLRRVLADAGRRAVTFGETDACDFRVKETSPAGQGWTFRLVGPDGDLGAFRLSIPGRYNAINAAAAIAVAIGEGADPVVLRDALPGFKGLVNRFTVVPVGDTRVVKDYTSHPTGIRSVIASARTFAPGRILAVFKPYRFTMMHYLRDEYRTAFSGADFTLLTEMYTAGEVPIPGVDCPTLAGQIRSTGTEVAFVPEMDAIGPFLRDRMRPGDTVVFFGGDDLFEVADAFIESIRPRTKETP